jgi:hypothetical protein
MEENYLFTYQILFGFYHLFLCMIVWEAMDTRGKEIRILLLSK